MDDIKRALLGNKEAAKRLTETGCWCRVRGAMKKRNQSFQSRILGVLH